MFYMPNPGDGDQNSIWAKIRFVRNFHFEENESGLLQI